MSGIAEATQRSRPARWGPWAARAAADRRWGRRLGPAAAVATGLLLAAAFPNLDAWPLAFVALVPLLLVAERRRPAAAFRLGWLAGLVFFGLHAQWVALIGDERGAGVAAWLLLDAIMAVFVGLFFALVSASRRLVGGGRADDAGQADAPDGDVRAGDDRAGDDLAGRAGDTRAERGGDPDGDPGGDAAGAGPLAAVARVALLAAAWAALEIARAHWPLGGFAWGLLGLSQHAGGPLLPLARVVGVFGLSAVIVAVNLTLAAALPAVVAAVRRQGGWRRPAALLAAVALLPLLGLAAPPPPPPSGAAPKRLAVVQGNVPFDRDNRGRTTARVFAEHVRLTETLAAGPAPDLVIWAEGAADADPLVDTSRYNAVGQAARASRAPILLGATTELGAGKYHTEALLFTDAGQLASRYVKRRLVPFGEYIPFAPVLRRLIPATGQLPFDKVPGDELGQMVVGGVNFGTLICYETAYPEDTRDLALGGSEFIVMLANNASFGHSPITRQHLATSQLRAVEQGRTVVHAAISGISAVIGPDGRVEQRTGTFQQAIMTTAVEPRSQLTFYARHGRLVEAGIIGATATLLLLVAALGARARPAATAVVERAAH
jgi:apolipoprotein N-acyltransferase